MKLKLLYFLTLLTVSNAFSQTDYVYHNVEGCRKMIFTEASSGSYTSIVGNPNMTTGNTLDYTNETVSLIEPGSINAQNSQAHFKLPFIIEKGVEFTWKMKIYSANAGSNNSGSGRYIIRLYNSTLGSSGAANFWNLEGGGSKTGGEWQQISGTTTIPGARVPDNFDMLQIISVNNAAADSSENFYFDDLTLTINPALADTTADLDAGNIWYSNGGNLGVTKNEFRITVAENTATPSLLGNSNANVLKVTRGGNTNHNVRFHHGNIDYTTGVIKFRIFPVCVDTETTPNFVYQLRKQNDPGTQFYSDKIYLHEGLWNEVEITLANLTNDGSIATDNLYDGSVISFNDETSGNTPPFEYYIDSFQGPQGATTFTGTTDSDWATETNWSSYIPGNEVHTVIPTATTAIISATTGATTKDLTINGTGSLSITSGGSLIVDGTSTGNITYNVAIPDGNWHQVSSPLTGETYGGATTWIADNLIKSGASDPNNRGIARYQNGTPDVSTGPWVYYNTTGGVETPFASGTGYSMIATGATTYSFVGTYPTLPNSATITQGADSNNWNLVGNAAPAYIDVAAYITANSGNLSSGAFQALYVYTLADGYTGLNSGYIHPGQAFFVNSNVASGPVSTSSAMLSHQTGVTFYKGGNPSIDLIISEGSTSRKTSLEYLDNGTLGLDPGKDIGKFNGVNIPLNIYTNLLENNENIAFQKQALPITDIENMIVPVGVKASSNKEIIFSATSLNLPSGIKVTLEDRVKNVFTNLDDSDYKITLSEPIDGVGRFYLHTSSKSALSADDNIALSSVSIYKTNASNLRIAGLQQGSTNVKLYNILGKQVLNSSFEANGVKDVALPQLATGVYIVQLQTASGSLSKKIIME